MAHELEEIPLFPLHMVLFPYAQIHLNVFEDRYVQMVRYCREFDAPFGVALIRAGSLGDEEPEPYMVGSVARLQSAQDRDDGGIELHAYGERRFRIRQLNYEGDFPTVRVEPVTELEVEDDARTYALNMRVQESFRELVQGTLVSDLSVKIRFPSDPTVVSFIVASLLPLDNLEKQRLLELIDTRQRLNELREFAERHVATSLKPLTFDDVKDIINPN